MVVRDPFSPEVILPLLDGHVYPDDVVAVHVVPESVYPLGHM
jgi:hypothetical protein